jgi:predicted nuclease of restriction endonuclease-like (RecB) superfamily
MKTAKPISTTSTIAALVEQVRSIVQAARRTAVNNINSLQIRTNFEIGRLIVEHKQQGQQRAAYGKETLKAVSASLSAEFGRGFSETNLRFMRQFFLNYQDRLAQIVSPLAISQKASDQLPTFTLSWSHYVLLLSIKDTQERSFYEIEAAQNSWSLPALKRQLNSGLKEYQLYLPSKDDLKRRLMEWAKEQGEE